MRIPLDIRLESARCYLRAVSSEDVDCVWTASRVEGFTDGMTWDPPETVDQIHEATERTIEKWQQGNDFTFSICLNESDECIGRIVIRKTDRADIWDIGYWLHPNFQGKGYMSEAAERIIEFGFLDLQAQSIESAHALWNEGSGKVLLNAGFGYVRNNPEGFFWKHGNWIEEKEYVLKKKTGCEIIRYRKPMFTGIIEATAEVTQKTDTGLTLKKPTSFTDIAIGSSIAVSGVCLSVTAFTNEVMSFDVVPETWAKSALGSLNTGDTVNLERAMAANGRFDGHIVQGHIEGVGECVSLEHDVLTVKVPDSLIKFCVQKGSVTLNGVSLTLATVEGDTVTVALVPHTMENTTFGTMKAGDKINMETDILGRYLYAFTHAD